MKNFEEMKKDNKGFSLVELIVVIAIMAVLIAVLGSTILGYVEKSKYSKDIQALDSIKTAVSTCVAEANTSCPDGTYTLVGLMEEDEDNEKVISNVLAEVFDAEGNFNNSSLAFEGITMEDVDITLTKGAVYIVVESQDDDYDDYVAGTAPADADDAADEG